MTTGFGVRVEVDGDTVLRELDVDGRTVLRELDRGETTVLFRVGVVDRTVDPVDPLSDRRITVFRETVEDEFSWLRITGVRRMILPLEETVPEDPEERVSMRGRTVRSSMVRDRLDAPTASLFRITGVRTVPESRMTRSPRSPVEVPLPRTTVCVARSRTTAS